MQLRQFIWIKYMLLIRMLLYYCQNKDLTFEDKMKCMQLMWMCYDGMCYRVECKKNARVLSRDSCRQDS